MGDSTTDGTDGFDRRASTRRACLLGARYRVGTGWHPATLVDLSARGCRLRIGEDLARNVAVRVELSVKDASPPVELSGIVVWCRLEGLSHQAGVHFDDAPDDLMDMLDAAE
jgi:PilZ domain-containing protein